MNLTNSLYRKSWVCKLKVKNFKIKGTESKKGWEVKTAMRTA